MLAEDDNEFATVLTTYTEARGALAKARIARGFYPVVVPADAGPQARFGRIGGQGKKKRGGKGRKGHQQGPPRPKTRARSIGKAPPPPKPQWARLDRPAGATTAAGNRLAPI